MIFRLLLISGALMAWRTMYVRVKLSAQQLMQKFGEQIREAA